MPNLTSNLQEVVEIELKFVLILWNPQIGNRKISPASDTFCSFWEKKMETGFTNQSPELGDKY